MINNILVDFHNNLYENDPNANKKSPMFQKQSHIQTSTPTAQKLGVMTTTALGVGTSLLCLSKYRKIPLKMLFKNKSKGGMDFGSAVEIMSMALGSVGGGLLGGIAFDKNRKQNVKAKLRESVVQLLGNISTPLALVGGGISLYSKHMEKNILKILPKFKGEKINNVVKNIPKCLMLATSLGAGIVVGNKVSNFLNEKVFKVPCDRKVKIQDFSAHIDDMCFGISLAAKDGESAIAQTISKIIPLALMVAGNSVGNAEETSHPIPKNI